MVGAGVDWPDLVSAEGSALPVPGERDAGCFVAFHGLGLRGSSIVVFEVYESQSGLGGGRYSHDRNQNTKCLTIVAEY